MTFFGWHPASLSGLLATKAGVTSREEIRENPDENLHPPVRLRTVILGQKGSLGHDVEFVSGSGSMPKSKVQVSRRSGRINGQAATNPIIVTTKIRVYRVTNTGKVLLTLKYADGGDVTLDVKKNCSVDLRIPAGVRVFVTTPTAVGVFETIGGGQVTRSGHFKGTAAIVIAKKRKDTVYRVFNGGENPLQTDPGPIPALAALTSIPAKCSRDFLIASNELKVAPVNAAPADRITGAYDFVDPAVDLRSGRFQFEAPAAAAQEYLIADFSREEAPADPMPDQTYRITNTGEDPFDVMLGSSTTKVATLATDQSLDVQFPCETPESYLKIKAAAGKAVAGIFDNI